MPLPFLAQLGIAAAPTAIKAGANLLRGDRKSPYERELSKMAGIFKEQASAPVSENRAYKEGKRQVDRQDEKNRESIQNSSTITGATDEARLASVEDNNEVYADAMSRLFSTAQAYRDRMRDRYLNTLGAQQTARQATNAEFQRKLGGIIDPLSRGAQSFLLSDMFSDGEGGSITGGDVDKFISETPKAKPVGGVYRDGLFGGRASTAEGIT